MRRTQADGRRPASRSRADDTSRLTRRRLLRGTGVALVSALAGCGAVPGDDAPDDPEYERLRRTAVYVDQEVSLSIPDEIPTVTATNNADLLVLPGDADAGAEQAVDWLADERALALLGDGAESTWLDWARSAAYRDTFGEDGVADGEPDPQLLVAAAVGLDVPTYRHTWADGPRDRDVLGALDEDLADAETRTPR